MENYVRAPGASRRAFMKAVGTLPAVMAASPRVAGAAETPKLPQVQFGKHSIPRLICGSNPFGGVSHRCGIISLEMTQYYTPEQLLKTYRRCVDAGIDTFENPRPVFVRRFADEGIKIQGFGRMNSTRGQESDPALVKAQAAAPGILGLHHYGQNTDRYFQEGKLDIIQEYTKRARDTGVLVGVTAHIPEAIAEIESRGWDVDYYMPCVYQWGRTKAEFEKLFGDRNVKDLLPVETYSVIYRNGGQSEVFLSGDPPKMYKVIQQVKKPCLAFKILAAGRRGEDSKGVEQAFKEAFENIKPSDAVIVGIYDRYIDQASDNADYVRRFGATTSAAA